MIKYKKKKKNKEERLMLRNIKKRIIILGNRMPFSPEKQSYFSEIEKLDWIYNNMMIEGSSLTKHQVEDMLRGTMPQNILIEEPILIERLSFLIDKLYSFAEKSVKLDLSAISYIHHILTGDEVESDYRKKHLIIHEWDYCAIHPADIPDEMASFEALLAEANDADAMTEECFEYAEKIHNNIVKVLPYGEKDGLLARVAATYYLMEKGYPAVAPDVKEQEYNEKVEKTLKTGELQGFNELLKKEVMDRLGLMIQLTAY